MVVYLGYRQPIAWTELLAKAFTGNNGAITIRQGIRLGQTADSRR